MLLFTRTVPPKPPKKRSRAGCCYCKEKKKKCDERKPSCTRCETHGQECNYDSSKVNQRRHLSVTENSYSTKERLKPRRTSRRGRAFQHNYETCNVNSSISLAETPQMEEWHRQQANVHALIHYVPLTPTLTIESSSTTTSDEDSGSDVSKAESPPERGDVEEVIRNGDDLRLLDAPFSTACTTLATPYLELSVPMFQELTEDKSRRHLVDHFARVMSHLIVLQEDQGNPFQQLVLPLAQGSSTVLNAIYALASAHLEHTSAHDNGTSFLFYDKAIHGLRRLIEQGCGINKNELLAAIILMIYCEVLLQPGRPGFVHRHLKGAMAIMSSTQDIENPTSVFLERAFRFYDVITALSFGTAPISSLPCSGGFGPFPPIDCRGATVAAGNADTLLGLATPLWPVIYQLSTLSGLKDQANQAELLGDLNQAQALRLQIQNTGQYIEDALQNWQPDPLPQTWTGREQSHVEKPSTSGKPQESIANTALAYRHSGLVYLFRTIYSYPREHPEVQHHTHASLEYCMGTVLHQGPMGAVLWPLFVAACEAMNPTDRELARQAFTGVKERQRMKNIEKARDIVEEVWKRADREQEELTHMDEIQTRQPCQDLWREVSNDWGVSVVFG